MNTDEPTRCNSDLLIYKISSTCFGQSFAHHQERETEILQHMYEGWNFNSGNYLFTTDTK